jgi:hypothetical protein
MRRLALMAKNAETLPSLEDCAASAEPLLHCTWCLARVTIDDPHPVLVAMSGPFEPGTLLGKTIPLEIEGQRVDVFVPTFLESQGFAGSQIVNFTCSARCQRELRRRYDAAAREDAKARKQRPAKPSPARVVEDPPPPPSWPRDTSDHLDSRTRAKYERQLRNRCAYCLAKVQKDTPVILTGVWLQGDPDLTHLVGHMMAVDIGGRPIAGYVPEPGSVAAARHGHVAFLMCSEQCAASFAEDVRQDTTLTVVH